MLLRVPKGAGRARISTAAVTAAITGTTLIIEYHPATTTEAISNQKRRGLSFGLITRKTKTPKASGGYVKFITLEGVPRVYLNNRIGESVLIPAGQMLILMPDATHMPNPVDVDLERLLTTSLLIIDFAPLDSMQLITDEVRKQQAKKAQGKLIDTNLVIYGRGTLVTLVDPPPLDPIDQSIAAMSLASAAGISEVGPLKTITNPNPYMIGAGSTIKTAPTITTSGVRSQGKLYRGVAKDGLPSNYFFGSTTAFDTSSGFNASVVSPTASFKFSDLLLIGDPTIKVPKGGALDLAFISENQIASEAPGGTLTFAGMNSVLFATTNSTIHFDTIVSFANLGALTFYVRGAGSTLFIGSQIQNVGAVNLFSEGGATISNADETLTKSNSIPGDGGTLTGFANGDILVEGSHIMATSGVIPTNGAPAGAGGNVNLTSINGGITLSGSTIKVSSSHPPGTLNRRFERTRWNDRDRERSTG